MFWIQNGRRRNSDWATRQTTAAASRQKILEVEAQLPDGFSVGTRKT